MHRRGWTVIAGAVVVLLLAAGLAKAPVPYVALAPGRAVNTLGTLQGHDVIGVDGTPVSQSDGRLSFTTVAVYDGIDLVTALKMWFDDDVAVVPRESIYPPGKSQKEVDKESEADFVSSQQDAEVAALRELGYDTVVKLVKTQKGSPAAGLLQPGDTITSVDGEAAGSAVDVLAAIAKHQPGETVSIGYSRESGAGTVDVPVRRDPDDKSTVDIGVTLEERADIDFDITFDIADIGGPSAGLMFALGIVDKIDPDDLTGGNNIAGTGTINAEGEVGPIGGIPQKMVAARETGAKYFFSPVENCEEAKDNKPKGLTLIKVADLDDALQALATIRAGEKPPSC